jgi:hypothetical protein
MIEPVDRDENVLRYALILSWLFLFMIDARNNARVHRYIMDIQYEIIYGHAHELRKITYREDLVT